MGFGRFSKPSEFSRNRLNLANGPRARRGVVRPVEHFLAGRSGKPSITPGLMGGQRKPSESHLEIGHNQMGSQDGLRSRPGGEAQTVVFRGVIGVRPPSG